MVQGFAQLARHRLGPAGGARFDAEVAAALQKIEEAALSMAVLMGNARAITALCVGPGGAAKVAPTDMARVADASAKLLEPLAAARKVALDLDLAAGTWALAVPGFESVAQSVIDNAIKFTPAGGRVRVRLRPGPPVALEVIDDGPGVPAALRTKLFQPFERLGQDARATEGQGLGLSIAATLVELSRGSITVEERLDGAQGTRVVVRLHPAPQGEQAAQKRGSPASGPTAP